MQSALGREGKLNTPYQFTHSSKQCGANQVGETPLNSGSQSNSRVAVWNLVVALVGFHGELEAARVTSEASLMPYLGMGTVVHRLLHGYIMEVIVIQSLSNQIRN